MSRVLCEERVKKKPALHSNRGLNKLGKQVQKQSLSFQSETHFLSAIAFQDTGQIVRQKHVKQVFSFMKVHLVFCHKYSQLKQNKSKDFTCIRLL